MLCARDVVNGGGGKTKIPDSVEFSHTHCVKHLVNKDKLALMGGRILLVYVQPFHPFPPPPGREAASNSFTDL